jgi:GTP-binding protein
MEGQQRLEPLEEVTLEVADSQAGAIIEALTARRGDLQEMGPANAVVHSPDNSSSSEGGDAGGSAAGGGGGGGGSTLGRTRLVFEVPSRGMIGFKAFFAELTRGEGLLQRAFAR